MNARLKPLALCLMLVIANPHMSIAYAQEAPPEVIDPPVIPEPPEVIDPPVIQDPPPEPTPLPDLPTSVPYPTDKLEQLPDFENAGGNGVTFTPPH